jgi:single-strand DNA-binding protein
VNFIHIAGHLGADPEVRFTTSGKKVTTLRVATRSRKGGQDETVWWRVSVWGEEYDKMISYLKKGSPVIVFGEMSKPSIYTDRDGKPQISLDITASAIQFSPFGKPDGAAKSGEGQPAASHGAHPAPAAPFGGTGEALNPYMTGPVKGAAQGATYDDEIPF